MGGMGEVVGTPRLGASQQGNASKRNTKSGNSSQKMAMLPSLAVRVKEAAFFAAKKYALLVQTDLASQGSGPILPTITS